MHKNSCQSFHSHLVKSPTIVSLLIKIQYCYLHDIVSGHFCMNLKFSFNVILILTKLNAFVVLLQNRIRISGLSCKWFFKSFWIFFFFLVISIFHGAFFSFCFACKFLLSFFICIYYLMVLNTFCCFLKD